MKKSFYLFLLVILLPVLGLAQDNDKEALFLQAIKANPNNSKAHFNLGIVYLNGQKYDQAIPEFKKCIQLDSSDSQAKELLGICEGISARNKGDYQSAIKFFQDVLKINPQNADASRMLNQSLAKNYMDQNKYAEAVTALTRVVEEDPKNFSAYQNLGLIYYQQKDFKKAVSYWEQALRLQKEPQIYKVLGSSYYNLGDFNNAILNYKKFVQLETSKDLKEQNPESLGDTYYNLGVAYNDNALYDDAAEAFEQAYKVNPKDSNAAIAKVQAIDVATNSHMEKASTFLLSNKYSDAIGEWQKVLKYQPDNKQAQDFIADAKTKLDVEVEKHYTAGKAFQQKGSTIQALNEWNLALQMDPSNERIQKAVKGVKVGNAARIKALLAEGDTYYSAKDYSAAFETYLRASKIDSRSPQVKARLKKLKSRQTTEIDLVFAKAMKFASKGDLKNAQTNLMLAKQIDPGSAKINEALFKVRKDISVKVKSLNEEGISLFQGGNKEKAQAKFQEVLKYKADDETANEYVKKMTGQQSHEKADAEQVKALYYDGVNLYINGKIHEAIAKWDLCLKQDPNNINAKKNKEKALVKLQSIEKLSHN